MEDNKAKNQISIELNEEVAQGVYSNLAVITHSSSAIAALSWQPTIRHKIRAKGKIINSFFITPSKLIMRILDKT